MSNFNTVSALVGGTSRGQINPLVLASTTETAFSVTTDTGTAVAVLSLPAGNTGNTLVGSGSPIEYNLNSAITGQSYGRKGAVGTAPPYFSTTSFDSGRPFIIHVTGYATLNAGAGNTVALNVYQGTSATLASDTKIAALTAGGAPSTTVNFNFEINSSWDSVSQVLGGYYIGQVGNSLTAAHALSNAASVTTASSLTFVVSGVFGNSGGGTITISEFSVEQQ